MSVNERVAVLESRQKTMALELDSMNDKLDEIGKTLDSMNQSMSRQKGFITGMIFVVSAVGFVLSQAWSVLRGG